MGKRRNRELQEGLWLSTASVVQSPGHAFYAKLETLLRAHRFDECVEHLCARFYKGPSGHPSIAPGVYFRSLLIGYFEGIESERGIAWRVADSLSLRQFLGYGIDESTPDHSTISRTRRLIWVSTHRAVFRWVLKRLEADGLLSGKTLGVDATTLEANAAMKSIVRRRTGEAYWDYLKKLAEAAGIVEPTREQLARFDRRRKKKGSNREWRSPADSDARITRLKDGRTHLAHKAEHAVDLQSGAVVAVTVQRADAGDTTTLFTTLAEASDNVGAVRAEPITEVVADRGYHSGALLRDLAECGIRTYVAEPLRKRRRWKGRKKEGEQRAVYANRRRLRRAKNKRLQKKRAELNERSNAHLYETGGLRRVFLRGRDNIAKRLLLHAAAFNLGLLMRARYGRGTPRGLAARRLSLGAWLNALPMLWQSAVADFGRVLRFFNQRNQRSPAVAVSPQILSSTTGC
jgi:transposase